MSEPYHWSVRRRGPLNHVRLLLLAVLAIMVPVPAFVSIFPAPPRAPRLHAGGGGNSVNREELRKSLVAEGLDDILAARAVEAADKAVSIWEMQVIDFCRPPEVATMTRVLGRVADLSITCGGGFPQAERQRVFFSRALDYAVDEEDARKERGGYLAAISVEGNFIFDRATHRDFLGALLGTGIAREKVGDILLQGERGAHVVVAPDVAEYVVLSLAAVRSVPVKNKPIALADLGVRPPVTKEVRVGVRERGRGGGRTRRGERGKIDEY
ncbi:photosystem ii s4 domain protein [Nannochloropsis gaditana]|uniref:Photosystem ii s4 domain protein n=1 Tax=Nannochloropsis gaditana TaxID=72520 RepID=W7T5D4_9STRA|nr:photosystem ii s4 domain protein [Nannochloropsis gaditana]